MKIKRIIAVVFCFAICSFLVAPVFATEDLSVEENSSEKNEEDSALNRTAASECLRIGKTVDFGVLQEKGRTYTKELTLENVCMKEQVIKAEIIPFENDDLSNERKATSDWLVLMGGIDTYVIPGTNAKNINLRITLPLEVEGGSYYAALKLSSNDNTLDVKIPVRLDVFDDKFGYDGVLEKSDFGILNIRGNIDGTVKIANNGSAGFESTVRATLKPLFGGEEKEIYNRTSEVLPGTTMEEHVYYSEASYSDLNGIYKAAFEVSYVNNEGRVINYKTSRIVLSFQKKALIIIGEAVFGLIVLIVILKATIGAAKRKKTNKKYKDVDNEL